MRRILAFIFIITFALNLTFATTSFSLILNKEGTTNIGFYDGYTETANQITRLSSLSSPDNTSSASATFYVKANIFSDIFSLTDESYSLSITFFATNENEAEDFMLVKENDSTTGLVYNYEIANITDGYISESDIMYTLILGDSPESQNGEITILDSSLRNSKIDLENRTKVLLSGKAGEAKSEVYSISVTINPPEITNEEGTIVNAFTSGQYMGYVRLGLVSN